MVEAFECKYCGVKFELENDLIKHEDECKTDVQNFEDTDDNEEEEFDEDVDEVEKFEPEEYV